MPRPRHDPEAGRLSDDPPEATTPSTGGFEPFSIASEKIPAKAQPGHGDGEDAVQRPRPEARTASWPVWPRAAGEVQPVDAARPGRGEREGHHRARDPIGGARPRVPG